MLRALRTRRILALAAGVVAVPWLALSIAALPTMSAYIAPEQAARAAAVANIVASAAEQVVSLHIPLTEEPGMQAYLDQILSENSGIGFIAICDAQAHIVHAAQAVSEDAPPLKLARGTPLTDTEAAAPHTAFVTRDVVSDGKRFGAVVVGQSLSVPVAIAREMLIDLAIGFGVLLLFTLEGTRLLLGIAVIAPLRASEALLARVSRKDLTRCLVLEGSGAVAELVAGVNRVLRALNDRCGELLAYAEEVRQSGHQSGQDRDVGPAIAALVAAFRLRVRLPAASPLEAPPPHTAAPVRFAWFLLSAGAAAGWPAWEGVRPLAAMLLSAGFAGWSAFSLLNVRDLRARAAMVIVVSVLALADWLPGAIGFGMGLALLGAVLCRVPQPESFPNTPGILCGVAAGLGIAAIAPPGPAGTLLIVGAMLITLGLSRRRGPVCRLVWPFARSRLAIGSPDRAESRNG